MAAATRYRPQISTNRLAELYAAEAKVPEEEMAAEWEECSLLAKNVCSIYDLRPFGCRCFVSRKKLRRDRICGHRRIHGIGEYRVFTDN